MNADDTLTLNEHDNVLLQVQGKGGKRWLPALVCACETAEGRITARIEEREGGHAFFGRYVWVMVRRLGMTRNGRPYRTRWVLPHKIRRTPPADPQVANVYADFLEESGQTKAAEMLRAAFPLGPPEEPVQPPPKVNYDEGLLQQLMAREEFRIPNPRSTIHYVGGQ